jgi:DNA-binding LacI/PurR family transcriptional regulator
VIGLAATIHDVAQRAGVSIATVSYVLNGGPRAVRQETRQRVLRAVEELEYHPNLIARRLATRKTKTIAVVLGLSATYVFSGPYFSELLLGISETTVVNGYALNLETYRSRPKDRQSFEFFHRVLTDRSVDGAIIGLVEIANLTRLQVLLEGPTQDRLVPFVVLEPVADDSPFNRVVTDLEASIRAAILHLIRLGHRRIGFIGGDPTYLSGSLRPTYFRQVMAEHDLPVEDDLVVNVHGTQAGGAEAMQRLLVERPSAVFAANDMLTLGALSAIRDAGLRVPEDIALVGFDGRYAEHIQPPLTAVRVPAYDVGRRAAELLIDLVEGRIAQPWKETLRSELILRESCGRLLSRPLSYEDGLTGHHGIDSPAARLA